MAKLVQAVTSKRVGAAQSTTDKASTQLLPWQRAAEPRFMRMAAVKSHPRSYKMFKHLLIALLRVKNQSVALKVEQEKAHR